MPNKIIRKYRMEDEVLLVRAQVKHTSLINTLSLFNTHFPFIDAVFAADFQAKIKAAQALALDHEHVAEKRVLTQDLKNNMVVAYQLLRTLDIYAILAYPQRSDKHQRAFGQDHWSTARFQKDKLIDALDLAHQKLSEEPFKTDLPAKGFSATLIAQLATHAETLRTHGAEQKSAGKNRPISTQDRVTALNTVWDTMKTLRIAAQVAFETDPAQRKIFQLYPSKGKKKKVVEKDEGLE